MKAIKHTGTAITVAAFLLLLFAVSTRMSVESFRSMVDGLGFWGPVIVILYFVVSHVVAPVSSLPAWLAAFSAYGIIAFLYIYIAGLISATICFFIAKKWGRPVVEKLVNKSTMVRIDRHLERSEDQILIAGRTIGFPLFEVVSYAGGFMPITYKRYITITAIFSAIPTIAFAYFMDGVSISIEVLAILGFVLVAATAIYSWYVYANS